MINNLFIFGVHLINLFNYLSLKLNLKQLNTVTLALLQVSNGLARPGPKRPDYINGSARSGSIIIGPQILEPGPACVGHGPARPGPFIFKF